MSTGSRPPRAGIVALACAIGNALSVGPIFLGTFPVFLQPVSAEFHWGRSVLPQALLIPSIVGMIVFPLMGRAVDRWGARRAVLPGTVLFGCAIMALGTIDGSLVRLYLLYGAVGFAGSAGGLAAYPKILSAWFRTRRGLALGIVLGASTGLSIAVIVPLTHHLIGIFGWRETYVLLGAMVLLAGLPSVFFLAEPAPPSAGQGAKPAAAVGMTPGAAIRTSAFRLTAGALFLNSFAVGGFRAHAFAFLGDRGYSGEAAAAVLSTVAMSTTAGQVAMGFFLDRSSTPRVGVPFFLAALVGLLLIDHNFGYWPVLLVGAAILGFGVGAETSISPYYGSRFFGLRGLSEIQAYKTVISGAALAIAPVVLGRCFDAFGSYAYALLASEAGLLVSVILIARLGPYTYRV